jgi:hypothetical protein
VGDVVDPRYVSGYIDFFLNEEKGEQNRHTCRSTRGDFSREDNQKGAHRDR